MKLMKWVYEKTKKRPAPYYYDYSPLTVIKKPIRKWITNSVAYNCPFNCIRICLYRLAGFSIGKNCFIGMHSYLDDMCYDMLSIGDDVIISYGVYFACHGRHQGHYPIVVEDRAYIGMRASVISKKTDGSTGGIRIGKDAVVGACALVNKDIPDGYTAVGVPCKVFKSKKQEEEERNE